MTKAAAMIFALTALSACKPAPPQPPHTYGDVAKDEEAACRRKYPESPETYCRQQGLIEALKKRCEDQPWVCNK